MRQTLLWLTALAAVLVGYSPAPAQVLISEIRIDDVDSPTNEDEQEYYELRGPSGTPLGDLTYVVLGKRPIQTISGLPYGGAGVIIHANGFPANAVMPNTGRFLVRKPSMQLPIGLAANLTIPLFFDDDTTQTHLLVRNFNSSMFDDNVPPNVGFTPIGFDLDLDNDGVLEIVPWDEVVDGVSIIQSTTFSATNRAYTIARAGPASDGIPAHLFRCGNNPNWRVGRRAYQLYTPNPVTIDGPQQVGFDSAQPYSATLNGLSEAGSNVRIRVQLSADMDADDEAVEVWLGGVLVATIAGGYPECGSGVRFVGMSMNDYNALFCLHGSSMQVEVIANGNVEPCVGSNCSVRLLYDAANLQTSDSAGQPNPACGCSCEFPNGSVQVVFLVDTSTSMDDEAAALCAALPEVSALLGFLGTEVQATILGITAAPGGAYDCLTGDVLSIYGPVVPNAAGDPVGVLDHPESWGDATAIVADRFAWVPGAARLIVTVSDEAPYQGNGNPSDPICDLGDAASVANAIAVANARSVTVSTLVGTGAATCVQELAAQLADLTGGGSTSTQLPATEIATIIADFLLDAASSAGCASCKGDLNLDGVVDAADFEFYECIRGFACRDLDNDGQAGTPNDQFIVLDTHTCGAADFCGITTASCLIAHPTPGCIDGACCALVCAVDPDCCITGWDGVCVTLALEACGTCGSASSQQSCFGVSAGPGCNEPTCCNKVCSIDPSCCSIGWDATCVTIARLVCLDCGSDSVITCFLPNDLPFCDDPACCAKVCANDPSCCDPAASWDVNCVALARTLCVDCGDDKLWPCNQLSFAPGCSDEQCCQTVCQIDPLCCQIQWDQQCVDLSLNVCLQCGSQLAGSCCVKHANPFCKDALCCESVCDLDPFCCTGSWDQICVSVATIVCPSQTCPCGTNNFNCFAPHARQGCKEALCCQLVCEWDDFCCLVQWDTLCANFAKAQCGTNGACVPGTGSCTVSHPTPGCDSPASCCSLVCTFEPSCCTVAWDFVCVDLAFDVCGNCGNPDSGSCYASSGSAGCADPVCCQSVCDIDPFCCSIGWDGSCANLALSVCGSPALACSSSYGPKRNCFTSSPGRGCRDTTCCNRICLTVDSFCCEVEWDAICALEALTFCGTASNTFGIGSCFTPHCCGSSPGCTTPCSGCNDRGCASAVCAYRPTCCTAKWDALCVDLALALCIDKQECPSAGPCNQAHRLTGCSDPSCCNAVCNFDPECCITEWDASCVDAFRIYCLPPSTFNCPCDGTCFEPKTSPGCNDRSCCAAVCAVEEACCLSQWDAICASLARDLCCGNSLCGDPCNKDCLVVHAQPSCSDAFCCEAVCAADPICCEESWDTLCVQYAAVRCVGACGQPSSGNCFTEHGNGGCRLPGCCKAVCLVDPTCCQEEWDSACATIANTLPTCVSEKPKCGNAQAGSCCTPHDGPACEGLGCCAAVCAIDPSCCQEEWDELCVNQTKGIAQCKACDPPCGAECAGSCCTPHPGPRCSNLVCCEAVCNGWVDENGTAYSGDSYCCNVEWDSNCASRANEYALILLKEGRVLEGPCFEPCPKPQCGSPLAGDCCEPHGDPFCLNQSCCEAVCTIDSFCCEISWDINCVTIALSSCPTCVVPEECGSGGSCFFPHSTPFCSDLVCCELVCTVDPTCCSVEWDFNCAITAFTLCIFQPDPPVNDDCIGAIALGVGLNSFTNFAATGSVFPSLTENCGSGAVPFLTDVWYAFTPPTGGVWEVSTCNLANFDTVVAVYEPIGAACTDGLSLRACNDNTPFCANLTSTVQWNGAINVTYLFRIGSPIGGTGNGFVLIRKVGP